jgi:hypothetical protein
VAVIDVSESPTGSLSLFVKLATLQLVGKFNGKEITTQIDTRSALIDGILNREEIS